MILKCSKNGTCISGEVICFKTLNTKIMVIVKLYDGSLTYWDVNYCSIIEEDSSKLKSAISLVRDCAERLFFESGDFHVFEKYLNLLEERYDKLKSKSID